jgi:hypothetical protein
MSVAVAALVAPWGETGFADGLVAAAGVGALVGAAAEASLTTVFTAVVISAVVAAASCTG